MKKKVLALFCCFFVFTAIFAGDDGHTGGEALVDSSKEDDSGSGSNDCKPKVLVEQPNYSIIYNMRNKTLGLTAGCVKKCGHSCTIKFVQTPKFK